MTTTTSPFVAQVAVDPMRQLLRDLRAAGWCHAKESVDTGRDSDGAPWDDGTEVHRWRRDDAEITFWSEYTMWKQHVTYEPDLEQGDQFSDVMIGIDWIERYGAEGLRKLAGALDILTVDTL